MVRIYNVVRIYNYDMNDTAARLCEKKALIRAYLVIVAPELPCFLVMANASFRSGRL